MPCLGHMLRPAVGHLWERRKERVFKWNNFVVLCSSGLQSPKSASSEAKGIHLSQKSVLLSVFHGLLHTMLHKPHYVANNNWMSCRCRAKLVWTLCVCVFRSVVETSKVVPAELQREVSSTTNVSYGKLSGVNVVHTAPLRMYRMVSSVVWTLYTQLHYECIVW